MFRMSLYNISFAVFVEKNARINTTYLRQPYRIAQVAFSRVRCLYIEVTSIGYTGSNHVECLIGRII